MPLSPTQLRHPISMVIVYALVAFAPTALVAQDARMHVTLNHACSQLASAPTTLMQGPEGRALLRFKRELDGAMEVVVQRSDSNRHVDINRLVHAQRDVDSLMQVVVRFRRGDVSVSDTLDRQMRVFVRMMDTSTRAGVPNVEAAIRTMQPQITAFSDEARSRLPSRLAIPAGYVGMHLSESKIMIVSSAGAIINYCDYPVIESVDPNSPAEKAGLMAADTILAYNNRDVQKTPVNYSEIFVAGQAVKMRVKRSGKIREVTVAVSERRDDRTTFLMSGRESGGRLSFSLNPRFPMSSDAITMSGSMGVIAGAQLSVIDDEFAQSLGVEPGVLIMRVGPGTAAAEAGLRGGEIIRAVNGTPIRDLSLLRRAFATPGTREVKLTVTGKTTGTRVVKVGIRD